MPTSYTLSTYSSGVTLPADDYLTITGAGTIGGTGLMAGAASTTVNDGTIDTAAGATGLNGDYHYLTGYSGYAGGMGAAGVTLAAASLFNFGSITGATGGAGGYGGVGYSGMDPGDKAFGGLGGNGAAGAAGVTSSGASHIGNSATITGGEGGYGGKGGNAYGFNATGGTGGGGGVGGDGVSLQHGTLQNGGMIYGGGGGYGAHGGWAVESFLAYGGTGGTGGAGGTALSLTSAKASNSGTIVGGYGGYGGYGGFGVENVFGFGGEGGQGGAGGSGVSLKASTFTNNGVIEGGNGGTGGAGGVGTASESYGIGGNGGDGGTGGAGVSLASGEVTNSGLILGGGAGKYGKGGYGQNVTGNAGYYGLSGDGVSVSGKGTVVNLSTGLIAGFNGVEDGGSGGVTVTNAGSIYGVNYAVQFTHASDLLTVDAGSSTTGEILGGGGTLAISGGAGTITGLGGAAEIYGDISGAFQGFGFYQIENDGAWTASGGGTLSASQALEIESGSSLSVYDGELYNAGSINLAATGVLAGYAGADLTNAGDVTGGGSVFGSMAITNTVSGVIDADFGPMLINNQNGGGLVNNGLIESSGTGALSLEDVTITGSGSILAGGTIKLVGAAIDGGSVGVNAGDELLVAATASSIGAGVSVTNGGAIKITSGASLTVDADTIDNTGVIDVDGTAASNADLAVLGAVTLSGGGSVALNADGVISGYYGATLTNADTITGGGAIFGSMAIVNTANGVIDDNSGTMLINNQSGGGLANAGLVESTGTGELALEHITISGAGTITDDHLLKLVGATVGNAVTVGASGLLEAVSSASTITAAVTNGGRLIVETGAALTIGGTLADNDSVEVLGTGSLTLMGDVTGAGRAVISGAGVLTVDAAMSQDVAFAAGSTGRLVLGSGSDFTGVITGLSTSGANAIDLKGVSYDSSDTLTYSHGVLTIFNGATAVASLKITGAYTASSFTLSNDGSGGTLVKDPPASRLAQAMAGFGASALSSSTGAATMNASRPPVLASPNG